MAIQTAISASRLPAVLTVLLAASMASGFGWRCPSHESRVTDADTIVIGRTIRITTDEFRPTLHAFTYEFHVDQVLKGERYKVGETIVRRYEFQPFGFQPFPRKDEGPHLVFVNRADDGGEYFGCTASLADVDLDGIRRQIKVQDDPPAFFKSDDERHVKIVLAWIRRTYFPSEPSGEWHADWSDKSKPNRETIIRYLLKLARGKNNDLCVSALEVLARIQAPEAFGTFKTALQSRTDGDKISHAARGLGKLGDERAIPLLFDRWTELREQNAERDRRSQAGEETVNLKLRSIGRFGTPLQRVPEEAVFAALLGFGDPRATEALLDSLSGASSYQTMLYMRQLNDPRAVEPLLRSLWQGNHSAIEQLAKYDDERINEEGRERLYDHPWAARLLAVRGDPSARAFMTRLIRQGFREGFTWAAVAREESVKADLVRALAEYGRLMQYGQRVGYTLGRIRAFDIVASVLDRDLTDMDVYSLAGEVLWGLSDFESARQSDCPRGEYYNCIGQSLREVGQREGWTAEEVELANDLLDAFKNREQLQDRFCLNCYPVRPWFPPESLPDMPDPLDKEATRIYLEKNEARWRRVFEEGSNEDMNKVLVAARYCEMNILDRDLAVQLLVASDWKLRSSVWFASVVNGKIALTVADIERWALTGGFESTLMAIGYIHRHPKPEYAPIVTKVFLRGRHLFVDKLFEAIIETKATDCIDLLRAYLENEHFALRVNAAITLIHLGDDAGKAVLAELEPSLRSCSRCMSGDYRQEALGQLN